MLSDTLLQDLHPESSSAGRAGVMNSWYASTFTTSGFTSKKSVYWINHKRQHTHLQMHTHRHTHTSQTTNIEEARNARKTDEEDENESRGQAELRFYNKLPHIHLTISLLSDSDLNCSKLLKEAAVAASSYRHQKNISMRFLISSTLSSASETAALVPFIHSLTFRIYWCKESHLLPNKLCSCLCLCLFCL